MVHSANIEISLAASNAKGISHKYKWNLLTKLGHYLSTNKEIVRNISTYDFGDGQTKPAIFYHLIPKDASFPAIQIIQNGGTVVNDFSSRQDIVYQINYSVLCWGDKHFSPVQMLNLAEAVYNQLRMKDAPITISIDNWNVVHLVCDIASFSPDGNGFPGYVVDVSVVAKQNR